MQRQNKNSFNSQFYCPVCKNIVPVASEKKGKSGKIKAYCPFCNKKQELINRKAVNNIGSKT